MRLFKLLLLPLLCIAQQDTHDVSIKMGKSQVCRGIFVAPNVVLTLSECVRRRGVYVSSSSGAVSEPKEIKEHPTRNLALLRTDFPITHAVLTVADQAFPYEANGQREYVSYAIRGKRVRKYRALYDCGEDLCIQRKRVYSRRCNYLKGLPLVLRANGTDVTPALLLKGCVKKSDWRSRFLRLRGEKAWLQEFAETQLAGSPNVCQK